MPADGGRQSDKPESVTHVGLSFMGGTCSYHEELASWWLDAIETFPGDIWRWVKHSYNEVKNFFIRIENGVAPFLFISEKRSSILLCNPSEMWFMQWKLFSTK